jgi:hypothetical protein
MKVEFTSELDLRATLDGNWLLLSPLSVLIDGTTYTVPAGFPTDLASVPRLPGLYTLFGGKARRAAVLHDWLYSQREYPREWCDAVFYSAMTTEEGWFTRGMMWLGVRVGGWAFR